jgi:S1-C subfamily serine protease
MVKHRTGRSAAALLLAAALVLVGCDTLDTQVQPQRQQPQTAETTPDQLTQQQRTQQQAQPTQAASPSPVAAPAGGTQPNQPAQPAEQAALSEYERIISAVYDRNIGAVVNLSYGGGTGSGFVIDRDGHIVTNNHVIENMPQINVSFADGSTARAELLGTFPEGDIAVVRASRLPDNLEPVELGDSGALRVGQIVVAIGSPLGLQQTVTSGIVSALNRSIQDLGETNVDSSLHGLIQTDASINPGNSGGPLFDSQGRVVGMNTLIASRTGASIGLGFAVPVDRIKRVVPQLMAQGFYQRPLLGVSIREIPPQLAQEIGLPTSRGLMVAEVTAGGPAEAAGLRGATEGVRLADGTVYPTDGDIIVGVNGHPIRTIGDLRNVLETETDAGDTITVTFLREGREQQAQLTLAAGR